MEKWITIGKALLFPHIAVLWILLPAATGLLVYGMVVLGQLHPISIAAYVLAFYTLVIWFCRIPGILRFWKNLKNENPYVQFWLRDARLRMNVSLYTGYVWNGIYAGFHLWLGIYHGSFWYGSLALYYFLLAWMRYTLSKHARHFAPGEDLAGERKRYRACGIVLLFMNLALALMVFFMIYWGRTFRHHQITAIAMAAGTFTSFSLATRDVIKYRGTASPVISAAKSISLVSACVSMLTLESTMLTAFGNGTMDLRSQRIFLGATGGTISALIISMAVYMITRANRQGAWRK